jgi:hypothetical protein
MPKLLTGATQPGNLIVGLGKFSPPPDKGERFGKAPESIRPPDPSNLILD